VKTNDALEMGWSDAKWKNAINPQSYYKVSSKGGESAGNEAYTDWVPILVRLMKNYDGKNKSVRVENGSINGKHIGYSWNVNDSKVLDYKLIMKQTNCKTCS